MVNLKIFGMMPGKKMTSLVKESIKDVTMSPFISYCELNIPSR